MFWSTISDLQLAARYRCRHDECTCFDPIRDDCMFCAPERLNAFDLNSGCPSATHTRPHPIQQLTKIGYLRFTRGIMKNRGPLSESCRHQQVFRAGYSNLLEVNLCAFQPT